MEETEEKEESLILDIVTNENLGTSMDPDEMDADQYQATSQIEKKLQEQRQSTESQGLERIKALDVQNEEKQGKTESKVKLG